jgi:hypothetical protein
MPPFAEYHDDFEMQYDDAWHVDGDFEIEAKENYHNGKLMVSRVMFVPHEPPTLVTTIPCSAVLPGGDETMSEEPNHDVPESLVESISRAFQFVCVDTDNFCARRDDVKPKPLKPVLRKPGDIAHPVERNVSFKQLVIKEFDLTLGNHPNASSGPPVMMDWDNKVQERVIDIDQYENSRVPRRNRKDLKMSYEDRVHLLFQLRGFSLEEVRDAWLEALMIRKQRHETRARGEIMTQIDEAWESTCRKCRRMFMLEI